MPSSISSSESAPRSGVARLTLFAGAGILLGGLLFTRCNLELVDVIQIERARVRQAVAALPEVAARPDPTLIFFGSSLVWNGFSSRVFDGRLREQGVELSSFNFGFGGMNPSSQRLLAQRMAHEYRVRGRRLALTLVEFTPFQATVARGENDALAFEQHEIVLTRPVDMARLGLDSPELAVRYLTAHYLRKSISSGTVTGVWSFIIRGVGASLDAEPEAIASDPDEGDGEQPARTGGSEREIGGLDLLFEILRENRGLPPFWGFDFRGDLILGSPALQAKIASTRVPTDESLQADVERRIRCCDLLELHFDERLVADFIALVHELAAVSDQIQVVVLPVNHAWVKRSSASQERLRVVLERIGAETGVTIADFSSMPGIETQHFIDSTHLWFTLGAEVFSTRLADHYAPLLR